VADWRRHFVQVLMRGLFDTIIAGAGPVGLALASFLSDAGLNVIIVEKQKKIFLENPAYDGREIALTLPSWKIMQDAGIVTSHEENCAAPLRAAAVVNGISPYRLQFQASEAGQDVFGMMLSNSAIRAAAYKAAMNRNIKIIDGCEVVDLQDGAGCKIITCDDKSTLQSRLVVAADSRFSRLRKLARIETRTKDFKRLCIVMRAKHSRSLGQTAFECFGYEKTMALLPLKDGVCSIVVTVPSSEGRRLMRLSEGAFIDEISEQAKPYAGEIELASSRYAYPLVGVFAESFYARRFVLSGDAAVGMHPVTAHGFNLGLSGARILADEIIDARKYGRDIGGKVVLRAYHDRHLRQTLPLYEATNILVGLYGRTDPISRAARQALLMLGNHIHPARRHIVESLAG
jgi:ubiquinone biosynthesis UbiH/UbiF/VisC/COQ6 family hydroxylase